jgi:hypothetical protein
MGLGLPNEVWTLALFAAGMLIQHLLVNRNTTQLMSNAQMSVANAQINVDMAAKVNEQLNRQILELTKRADSQDDKMEQQWSKIRILEVWNEMQSAEVKRLGGVPVSYEQAARRAQVPLESFNDDYSDLRHMLTDAFDPGELDVLVVDSGFKVGDITGERTSERASSLIGLAQRRGHMSRLIGQIKIARPHLAAQIDELTLR